MKRRMLFPVICLCLVLLMGCHEPGETPDETGQIPGEIYDTGMFQVLVPESWHIIPITDPFAEGRPVKVDCVFLRKGGQSDWHFSEKPYIRIDCYGAEEQIETQISDEGLLHNVQELLPMEPGELVWGGYTADSYHGRARIGSFALLWAEDGEHKYQILVWFESGGESICLEDRDLQAILASVTYSE